MKENNIDTNTEYSKMNGSRIPSQDPHFYEKVLLTNSDDCYLLYSLAFEYEVKADSLKENDKIYKMFLKKALFYFQLSYEKGYKIAKDDIERVKKSLRNESPISVLPNRTTSRKKIIIFFSVLTLLVFLSILLLF